MLGRLAVARAAAVLGIAAVALVMPASAAAHAQLVSATPGPGETVATSPSDLRLAFSEPLVPKLSSLDLLDARGSTVLLAVGAPDPADASVLVVPITRLADGGYTVAWRTVSAADGHSATGFYTFAVGSGAAGASAIQTVGGSVHAGHSTGTIIIELQGRIMTDLGFMLAWGLAIVGLLVIRQVHGPIGPGPVVASALALAAAAIGSLLLIGVATGDPNADPIQFATSTRPGQLLVLRAVLGFGGAAAVGLVGRAWATRRHVALAVGGLVGLVGLLLIGFDGHASGSTGVAPLVAVVVHLAAASIWLTGIAWLAASALGGPVDLRAAVPRFTALALGSVALFTLAGLYMAWFTVRGVPDPASPYDLSLLAKGALVAVAVGVGFVSFRRGGAEPRRTFGRRVGLEVGLAVGAVILAANMGSGAPPGLEQPVAIAAAPSAGSTASEPAANLGLSPGRAGPNRFVVRLASPALRGDRVQIALDRLDRTQGSTVVPLRDAGDGTLVADTVLPPDSRWNASVEVRAPDGTEPSRTRFVFGLDAEGVSEGMTVTLADPATLLAALLVGGGLVVGIFLVVGGRLPRAEPSLSRRFGVAAATVAVASGAAVGLLGPHL